MQANVEQILDGKYDYENSSLDFSCAKVEISTRSGNVAEGSFHIYSDKEGFTQGTVSASDVRMECVTREFTGNGEEIFYRFHAEHLSEGDVIKGFFNVISNQGEYNLPFVVTVEHESLGSSIGSVKNLFHFANLAKSDWHEAVSLFYSPGFSRLFVTNDRQYYDCYRGLSAYPGNEQNVEEFLIHINKKQKISYLVRENEIHREFSADVSDDSWEIELNITKNGWGYTALQVECEGDFLFAQKEMLRKEDFIGNKCVLSVFVDTAQCRRGKNFGSVTLSNSYMAVTVPVTIRVGERSPIRKGRLARKKYIVQLMECYQNFRMKRINSAEWMKQTGELVEGMLAMDDDDIAARLFHAQLLISEERYNEAEWTLDHAMDLLDNSPDENDTLYAYYMYLTTLIERREEYVNQITAKVQRLYAQDQSNWRIAWLLLYLSEELNKTVPEKWDFLERQFESGCFSPVFYIEALHLLNANPTLLRKLDENMLQILCYGARKEAISKDLAEQIIYLAGRGNDYSPVLLKILQSMYEKNADERILQQICALLVKGSKVGTKYSRWYEAGVEAQLRITNLYEYYIMSLNMSETKKLPRVVLMYFSYQNNLDLTHKAFLYWYVEQHKMELGEFYDTYRPHMEHFVVDQLHKERISRHLAFLYQRLLTPAMIDEETARVLARLLFAHRITLDNPKMKKVIVYQPGNLKEHSYTIQNGVAWMPVYGGDSTILFEDSYGNRFVKTVDYTLEKMMIPGKYLRTVETMVTDCRELALYLEENGGRAEDFSAADADRMRRLSEDELTSERIRRRLYLRLLKHYYDSDNIKAVDECLENVYIEMFTADERAQILRYAVLRERMDEAWEWLRTYGPDAVEQRTLLRLIDDRIEQAESGDEELTQLAMYTFRRGKYDSRLVQYLAEYAEGPVRELRDIYKAVLSFELDAYHLCERIIDQMLFSGAFVGEKMEIFSYYVSKGANPDVEEAFLARCAYDYFVKERLTDEIVFREITRIAKRKEETLRVCKLAFLKYYSENLSAVTEEEKPLIAEFLHEMLSEKVHLNFFRNYQSADYLKEPMLQELMDKTIVEYRAAPGSNAFIHYVIMHEDGESSEYLTEPMREVFGGVCFKEFVLFFGESLQYYIMEDHSGEEQLTESGNLQKSDIHGQNSDWRYEMINDILISRTLEDFDTLDSLMDEYCRREYLGENLFALQ